MQGATRGGDGPGQEREEAQALQWGRLSPQAVRRRGVWEDRLVAPASLEGLLFPCDTVHLRSIRGLGQSCLPSKHWQRPGLPPSSQLCPLLHCLALWWL